MKVRLAALLSILLCAASSSFGIVSEGYYITTGLDALTNQDIITANINFSNAVVFQPTNEEANVLYATTRLLVIPLNPVGSNFLSRLGFPTTGRSIYNWTAQLPVDGQNVPVAPTGVDADEATMLLRTNILAELINADANLAMVTDTNFTLSLTAAQTQTEDVTIDYGDIQLLRAMIQSAEYLIYNTYSWNLDVQLTVIRSFYDGHNYSVGGLLAAQPSLLTFASTSDLAGAGMAFTNGVVDYVNASDFIRARPPGTLRLFNLSTNHLGKEMKFRQSLQDLMNSFNGRVTLTYDSNYSVYFPALLNGLDCPRSFLPPFAGQYAELDALPDLTFGGFIQGLTQEQVDDWANSHGITLGVPADTFSGQTDFTNGWSYLAFPDGVPFGYYTLQFFPYVYHSDIGFVYYVHADDGNGGAYLYDFTSGDWWYMSPPFFPYIYDFNQGSWLYYCPDSNRPGHYTTGPRWFYNFNTEQWINLLPPP